MSWVFGVLAVGAALFGIVFFVVGAREVRRLDSSLAGETSELEAVFSSQPLPQRYSAPSRWKQDWERRLRVLLGEEHVLDRRWLQLALTNEPDIEIVGEASTGEEVLTQIELKHPDIVLLDVRMPRPSGLEVVKRIHESHPDVQTIIIASKESEASLVDAFRAGALGYIAKGDEATPLAEAVRQVAGGNLVIDSRFALALATYLQDAQAQLHAELLNPLENEVLRLLTTGNTSRQIAEGLAISPDTATQLIRAIFEKIGSATR